MSMPKIVNICYQIALGMEYLASRGVVHRDLAARNVLLLSQDVAKVSDFGMSRVLTNKNYYRPEVQNKKVPIKWFSPDSIQKSKDIHSDMISNILR